MVVAGVSHMLHRDSMCLVSTAGSAQVFNLACSDHFVKCNIHVGWSKTFSIPFAYHQTPHCTVHSLGLSAPQCAVGSKGPSW